MLTYGAQQLASSFRTVRKNTIQVAQDIPEDKYAHVPAEGARTVGRMLTHVAIVPMRLWHGMHGTRSTDMTGFDFCAKIRAGKLRPDTPILFCTVRSAVSQLARGMKSGGTDYVLKPFIPEDLLARVRAALRAGDA